MKENLLFSLGDALLAVIAKVDEQFLTKYGIGRNDQRFYNDNFEGLLEELKEKYEIIYGIGGSVYNTVKIFQWMLREPKNVCTYFCSVGNDETGKMLMEDAKKRNIDVYSYKINDKPTGVCIVLINGDKRSLIGKLDSAKHYSQERHLDLPENWKVVEEAEYYYLCGYFLNVSPESVLRVGKYAAENNKCFLFNISAPFVPHLYKDSLSDVLKYVDVLLGNDEEARAFAEAFGYPSDNLEDVAKWMRELQKVNTKRDRIVVVTCNKYDTIVATVEGVRNHPVIPVDEKDVVDTSGAGDSFVGGFLSQLVQGKSLEDCIAAGHYVANVIIRQVGCEVPDFKPDFK